MTTCPQCGRESPDEFGFCPSCGGALAVAAPAREVRKVVTVLFCDLTGSTAIGERTDPEALRALMNRYYDAARGRARAPRRHGGEVRRRCGDGRLRDPGGHRGRCAARRARCRRAARARARARARGAHRHQHRREWSPAREARSSPAMRSTWRRGSSRRPAPARSCSVTRRRASFVTRSRPSSCR